jgi:3-isopropylmalate dehydrogenase
LPPLPSPHATTHILLIIYFGQPRGVEERDGEKYGFNTATYYESEIRRIGHSAFKIAQLRNKRVCSVDKANVLEVCELWREVMEEVAKDYPDVELSTLVQHTINCRLNLIRQILLIERIAQHHCH